MGLGLGGVGLGTRLIRVAASARPGNQALHDAVQSFVAAAWDLLHERGELVSEYFREFKWSRADQDVFTLVEVIRPIPKFLSSPEIGQLPENLAVVRLLEADPIIGARQGKMIYLGSWAQRFGVLSDQASIVLNSLLAHPGGWSQADFEQAYLAWETDLYAEWNEATTLHPLASFTSDTGRMQLTRDAELRPMTDDEIGTCLTAGVLEPSFGLNSMALVANNTWCIAGSIRTRRLVMDPSDDPSAVGGFDEFNRVTADQASLADYFVSALRLHKAGDVRLAGQVSSLGKGGLSWHRSPASRLGGVPYQFGDPDREPVQHLWRALRNPRVMNNGGLQAALRRFGYSCDRLLAHDKIIDLMIAAEAFFVGSGKDELRYRLAVNGSNWMAASRPRRQTFDFLGHAYDVRSSIVHGSSPAKRALVSESGERLDENAFAVALESFMRDALRLAIERVASGEWQGDWRALMFGDFPRPVGGQAPEDS